MNAPGGARTSPVLLWMSILAALQVLSAGSALADVIPYKVAALFALTVAAAQAGVQFYVRGQVTPWQDVIAKVSADGTAIAGPAHTALTGTPVEGPPEPEPVDGGSLTVQACLVVLFLLVVLLVLGVLPTYD